MTKTTLIFFMCIFLLNVCVYCTSSDKSLANNKYCYKESKEILKGDSIFLRTGWYYVLRDSTNGCKRRLNKSIEAYFLDTHPIVNIKNFTALEIYESSAVGQKYFGLAIRLDKEGTDNWSIATAKSIGLQLAFILDNKLIQVSKVNSQITGGVTAINSINYTKQELENFKTILLKEK
jgi:hypothetical protein